MQAHGVEVSLELPQGDHITNVIQRNHDWYERRMLDDIYARTRGANGLALDIGACFGTHTTWFAAVCGLYTLAFEPASDSFEILQNNILANNLSNRVELFNCAVGRQEGFVTPTRPNPSNQGASPVKLLDLTEAPDSVKMLTIDSLLLRTVSLVKIDVEGMEVEVLHGAEATLRRDHPLVYVEAPDTYDQVWRFMESLGYHRIGKWNATPTYGWSV